MSEPTTRDDNDLDGHLQDFMAFHRDRLREAMRLRWTTQKPTVPGYYWWRTEGEGGAPEVVRVVIDPDPYVGSYLVSTLFEPEMSLEDASGEWAGPIPEPAEGP